MTKFKRPWTSIEIYLDRSYEVRNDPIAVLWRMKDSHYKCRDDLLANEDYEALYVELDIINEQEELIIDNWYAGNKDDDAIIKQAYRVLETEMVKTEDILYYKKQKAIYDKSMQDLGRIAKDINY